MREQVRDEGRLEHILLAIESVKNYTKDLTKEQLLSDSMRIHATAYNIQIIGEAAYRLTLEFKNNHPKTPWKLIEKMRHILVHDYFNADPEFIWAVIQDDLEPLKAQVNEYLKGM